VRLATIPCKAWGGDDILEGGAGDDTLYGGDGNDILIGGLGNDTLSGGAGADTYIFNRGDGNDTITGDTNNGLDTLRFGEGIALADLRLEKGNGNDLVVKISNNGGQITLQNWYYSPAYRLGSFAFADGSQLTANQLLETLPVYGTAAADSLTGNDNIADHLIGEAGNDRLYGYSGDDILDGGDGADILYGGTGNDILLGGDGDDTLNGDDGNDILSGGAGSDTLNGGAGNDILIGGPGNDILTGGAGADIYIFNRGDGNDTITADTSNSEDTLRFGDGISLADLRLEQSGSVDLVVKINNNGGQITLKNWFSNTSYRLAAFAFADGTQLTCQQFLAALPVYGAESPLTGGVTLTGGSDDDYLMGGAGNDTLTGNAGNDILDGGAGDDSLSGGAGNDTFVFGKGCGHDTVDAYEASPTKYDKIKLVGLTPNEVEFGIVNRGGYMDFVVRIKETGETMTVLNGVNASSYYQIQGIEFGDGTVWSWADVCQAGLHGTAAGESLTLSQAGALYGEAGNDILTGSTGNDAIYGGDGNDTLTGNAGNDILDGGAGDDVLTGGAGNDTFVFGKGYGHDTVDAYEASPTKYDKIKLIGLTPNEVEFGIVNRSGYMDFVVRIKETGETMTVLNGVNASSYYQIQGVEFDNGTILSWADVCQAGLHGTAAGESLTLNQAGALYGEAGNDILTGSTGNDAIYGGDGNDTLTGNAGNDILDGGAGDDSLSGGAGNDTFVFGKGYGHDTVDAYDTSSTTKYDKIKLVGLTPNEVEFGIVNRSGYMDFVVRIKETGETMTVLNGVNASSYYQIQGVEFDNGTILSWADVCQAGLHGTAAGESLALSQSGVLYGEGGNDTLTGSSGNDILSGGAGNDTLNGGAGNDILLGGAGNDILTGGAGNDTFVFESILDGIDSITDFTSGQDRLELAQRELSDLLAEMRDNDGLLPENRFTANNTGVATDASQRIIYDLKTGALWYDADGSGEGVATQFATLGNKPNNLKASDFFTAAS